MNFNHLKRLDIGLLVALVALVETRSVGLAANRMNMSQPAMSRALGRLQRLLGDEILIRTKAGYEPTRRALQACAEVRRLLPRLDQVLRGAEFDARETIGTVRIAASDYAVAVHLPHFLRRLSELAPNVKVQVLPLVDRLAEQLENGAIDLLLWANGVPPQFSQQVLFRDHFVCMIWKDLPGIGNSITVNQYLSLPHAVVALTDHQQGVIDQHLAIQRLTRIVRLETPYFASAAWTLEGTDMVLTVPNRLAQKLVKVSNTKIIPSPIRFPELEYVQVWSPRMDNDQVHHWFRECLANDAQLQAEGELNDN